MSKPKTRNLQGLKTCPERETEQPTQVVSATGGGGEVEEASLPELSGCGRARDPRKIVGSWRHAPFLREAPAGSPCTEERRGHPPWVAFFPDPTSLL